MFSQIPRNEEKILKDCLTLIETKIVGAFANSKFLIIDEMTNANALMTMKIDEFYEFICRIADHAHLTGQGGWTTPDNEDEGLSENDDDIMDEGQDIKMNSIVD